MSLEEEKDMVYIVQYEDSKDKVTIHEDFVILTVSTAYISVPWLN